MYASKLNLKLGKNSFGPPYFSKFPNNLVSNLIAAIAEIFAGLVSLAASCRLQPQNFSSTLALCKFGATRILQDTCGMSSLVFLSRPL